MLIWTDLIIFLVVFLAFERTFNPRRAGDADAVVKQIAEHEEHEI